MTSRWWWWSWSSFWEALLNRAVLCFSDDKKTRETLRMWQTRRGGRQKVRKMPRLEEVANVALRVPSILVLDLLYKCDMEGLTDRLRAKNEDMLFKYKYVIWNMYYIGKFGREENSWSTVVFSVLHSCTQKQIKRDKYCFRVLLQTKSMCLCVCVWPVAINIQPELSVEPK